MMRSIRVTCTVPADVLRAADRAAGRLDRSRSWVVTEALRRLVAAPEAGGAAPPREPAPELRRAFRAAEQARVARDMALTPAERVRVSEQIAKMAPAGRRRAERGRIRQFDTYEDYLDWKRFAGLEP